MITNEPRINWDTHRKVCDLVDELRLTTDAMSMAEQSDDFFYTNGSRSAYLREIKRIETNIRDLCPGIDLHRTRWSNSTWFDAHHAGFKLDHARASRPS